MSLEIKNLTAGYGDIVVLRDVSFTVPQDQIVSLLGANGAGKTTSLNAICGLLADVKSGSILLDGIDICSIAPHERVEAGLSQVPQGRHLFPFMSVRENLEMGAYTPRSHAKFAQNLDWVLTIFPKVKERLSQSAGSLSGGEQQMCAIARGLMSQPKYLLLDEPSLGLAPIVVKQVMSVIKTIAERGIGVLLVEQNVAQALKLAKYAYVLEHAQISLEGNAEDLAGDDRIRKAYLGL
jgi:branched-chain amino acid transport system ATP-binding protein